MGASNGPEKAIQEVGSLVAVRSNGLAVVELLTSILISLLTQSFSLLIILNII